MHAFKAINSSPLRFEIKRKRYDPKIGTPAKKYSFEYKAQIPQQALITNERRLYWLNQGIKIVNNMKNRPVDAGSAQGVLVAGKIREA